MTSTWRYATSSARRSRGGISDHLSFWRIGRENSRGIGILDRGLVPAYGGSLRVGRGSNRAARSVVPDVRYADNSLKWIGKRRHMLLGHARRPFRDER